MADVLTPDGRPFYGGTYFPPEDKIVNGETHPGFKSILRRVIELDTKERDGLWKQADRIADMTADALERNGTLTHEQARNSPWKNVLYKFLGCAEMPDGPEVRPFAPEAGDRLVLGSDGLTNFMTDDDLRTGAKKFANPQEWADHLVETALQRGSKDNVTCVIVAFERE